MGEAYRELVFANQKKLGIIPAEAELSPINPYTDLKGPSGQSCGELDVVRPWDTLSGDEKRLFSLGCGAREPRLIRRSAIIGRR